MSFATCHPLARTCLYPTQVLRLSFCAALVSLVSCNSPAGGVSEVPAPVNPADLAGTWRFVIDSAGGELPFLVDIADPAAVGPEQPPAFIRNGEAKDPITHVEVQGRRVTLRVAHYDSALTGDLDAGGTRLTGTWQKTSAHGRVSLPFHAVKGEARRFSSDPPRRPGAQDAVPSVDGLWKIEFAVEGHHGPAIGKFKQEGDKVTGTVLTGEGDFRYLEGEYRGGVLRLSGFNGAFAVLIRLHAHAGGSLQGGLWSNDDLFMSLQAMPSSEEEADEALPDPYAQVKVLSADNRIRFRFPDLEGKPVSMDDKRYKGKVVLVVLMGSWCQNCNDEAPLLSEWARTYRDRGLEIVGLSFEFTGDAERDRRQVQIYKERHKIDFPLLVAGTVNESQPLPDLSAIPTFPTTIFVGRDGTVRKVHTGFAGPGTGEFHNRLVAEFKAEIEKYLDEAAP